RHFRRWVSLFNFLTCANPLNISMFLYVLVLYEHQSRVVDDVHKSKFLRAKLHALACRPMRKMVALIRASLTIKTVPAPGMEMLNNPLHRASNVHQS
ncbi:MAG TPA: hypothetical protein VLU73_11080, partial [Methylococcaceae bacterium]|nr:hypothetical protein [Methylococcaceae bacterium]